MDDTKLWTSVWGKIALIRLLVKAREAIDASNQDVLQAAIVQVQISTFQDGQKFAPSVSDRYRRRKNIPSFRSRFTASCEGCKLEYRQAILGLRLA